MDEMIGTKPSESGTTLYNAELIEHAARVGHETVWMYSTATRTGPHSRWVHMNDQMKDIARRTVLVAAADGSAEDLHQAWLDMMLLAGWCYAQGQASAGERTHPALVPWDRLLPGQRACVEIFRAAVRGVLGMG